MMEEEYYEESTTIKLRKGRQNERISSAGRPSTSSELSEKLNHLMEEMAFKKSKFRRSEAIYKGRIKNDTKDVGAFESEDVKHAYKHLYSRYGEIGDYMLELNQYANKSLGCLKKLKRQTDLASVLSKPFNVLSAYLHLKENFEDHHKTQQQQLEQSIDYLDELKDVDELREYYEFLHTRYIELQQYSRMQEGNLQCCKDLLDYEMTSPKEEQEEAELDENEDEDIERSSSCVSVADSGKGCIVERSFSESSVENGSDRYSEDGFYTARSMAPEEQSEYHDSVQESQTPESLAGVYQSTNIPRSLHLRRPVAVAERSQTLSLSPILDISTQGCYGGEQGTKIPQPSPPRKAIALEDFGKKGLQQIPGHIFSQRRVAPESNVKIFKEKRPDYNGEDNKRQGSVKMQSSVLPQLQNKQQYRPQHSSQDKSHQDFMLFEDSYTYKRMSVKGIVKPNLIRKDLMKLKDPNVRARAPKPRDSSMVCGQELVLPRIPRPPPPRPNMNRNPNYVPSRIPKLPSIQQHRALSGIQRTRALPQPPSMSRSRASVASHRRYLPGESGLPFPRRQ